MRSSSPSSGMPVETAPDPKAAPGRPWSRATTAVLLLVGIVMGVIGFATVMSMGDMVWHGARDAELRATYQAYQETGTLLIKETGSGSYGVQAPADGPLTFATWDDDPGSYIIASLMYNITGSDSPYPGLRVAQALLVAIPLVWLPLAVARIVGRVRAGLAMVFLPLVVWLFNHGATLVGTEYGISDRVSTLPVYSLYGTAASLAFLSLSLIVLLSAYKLRLVALIGATLGIVILAAFGNLARSLSGMGIAAAVGVLWWIFARGRWRWVAALGSAVVTILLATLLQTGVMNAINVERVATTGQAMAEVPDAHTVWHSLYLGLSYPTPINGQPSQFDVIWSDEYGWAKAREIDPDVLVASEEYDKILQGLYLDEVFGDPVGAVKLYVKKALYVAHHFGGLLLFIVIGFAVGLSVKTRSRPRLGRVLAITTPLLLLGLVPAILVMPMLYYYSELAAALGLLAAVSLGVLVWALTSWPARARAQELLRTSADPGVQFDRYGLSVVIDGESISSDAVDAIIAELGDDDEIIVAASAGDDSVYPSRARIVARAEGEDVGLRMREAVLVSRGERVLVIGEQPSLRPTELLAAAARTDASSDRALPAGGRDVIRELFLGKDASSGSKIFVLDGDDARALARAAKEPSAMWFEEMLFAVTATGGQAVAPAYRDDVTASGIRGRRGTLSRLTGLSRIALRREEYLAAVTH